MRISRKVGRALISLLAIATVGAATLWISLPRLERCAVGVHQKSVTRSLATWAVEDARITNNASAIHAAEMIGYIHSYYVPGPGYRGPADVEAALERQRRASIDQLAAALHQYTGLDFGTNIGQWTAWAEKRKSNAPNGAPNVAQPSRVETSGTSVTTGSDH